MILEQWGAVGALCIGYEEYYCTLNYCPTPHNRFVTHNDYVKHPYGEHHHPSQGVIHWKEDEVLLDKGKVNSDEDGNVVQEISMGCILVARGGLLN